MARNTTTASVLTYADRLAESKEVKEAKLRSRAVRSAQRATESELIRLSDLLEDKQGDIETLKNSASFNIAEIVRIQSQINDIKASIKAVEEVKNELFPA